MNADRLGADALIVSVFCCERMVLFMIEMITASEKDIPVIEGILSDAAHWLNSIGKPLWSESHISWAGLSKSFTASDFQIALLDGQPAACMAVVDYDPFFWPDIPKGQSLFVHRLAVKRFAAGKGISAALLDHAKSMCMERDISQLRLDCIALIEKLRALYERNGFVCVGEKQLFGKYPTAFYLCEVHDTKHLYHYYEKNTRPFRSITALPFEEAAAILRAKRATDPRLTHPNIDWFLKRRYQMETVVRDKFIEIGGKPIATAPVYLTLGANEHMKTWFTDPAVIRIPVNALNPDVVSFTYGDMFAVNNPALNTGEEWWAQVYRYEEILKQIKKYGLPEDPEYSVKEGIFPKDRSINQYLKYIEVQVWDEDALKDFIP